MDSWSNPEIQDSSFELTLALAAARGISVNFSSGDCGDNSYTNSSRWSSQSSAPIINYLSSSAYVTAVGASAVFVNSNYEYSFETVWGKVINQGGLYAFPGGTGGGGCQFYGPVNWQHSISNFIAGGHGVISNLGNKRAVPDVVMLGDPQTGLLITSNGSQIKDAWTSLACPLFSASLILVNQARVLFNKGVPIGQAAPYLYQKN